VRETDKGTLPSRFLIKQAVQVLYATLKREDDGTKRDKNHITVRCERCQSIHTFIIRDNVVHRNIKFITYVNRCTTRDVYRGSSSLYTTLTVVGIRPPSSSDPPLDPIGMFFYIATFEASRTLLSPT